MLLSSTISVFKSLFIIGGMDLFIDVGWGAHSGSALECTGMEKWKVEPTLGSLFNLIDPPRISHKRFVMAKPRPTPLYCLVAEEST